MSYPILYSFRRCPYAIRARLAIAASNLEVELREVFLNDRPQTLYDISPKGTVPVLLLEDGNVIDESIDIMKWAADQSSSDWYNNNTKLQDELVHHNDFEFKQWLDKYKYHDRHPENTFEHYRDKCANTLFQYEVLLEQIPYLRGEKIQLVDMALFPFVRQCANVDREWFATTFPKVEYWLEHWIQSEVFKCVMPKFDAWKLGDNPLYISF